MVYEAYISKADYTDTYNGASIDADIFDRVALRASDELDKLTFRSVRRAGLSTFDR